MVRAMRSGSSPANSDGYRRAASSSARVLRRRRRVARRRRRAARSSFSYSGASQRASRRRMRRISFAVRAPDLAMRQQCMGTLHDCRRSKDQPTAAVPRLSARASRRRPSPRPRARSPVGPQTRRTDVPASVPNRAQPWSTHTNSDQVDSPYTPQKPCKSATSNPQVAGSNPAGGVFSPC
jgi:hypothetical protein